MTRQRGIGIALMLLAIVCFSALDSTAKYINRTVDPLFTVWARYVVAVILTFAMINPWTRPGVLRSNRLDLQLLRSALMLFTTICSFTALKYLQLVENMSIQFATPLLVALLAGPLLGEWVGPRRMVAIVIGLGGILIITRPGLGVMHPAALIALAGTIGYAFFGIITRKLAAHDSSATTTLYSGFVGIVAMTAILPWIWTGMPSATILGLLLVMGVLAAVGHWLLILAHARVAAATLSPLMYSQIIWLLILGYVVFGDWPDRWTFVGASVVIASGLYLLYREREAR
ncbi:DMT family transporter [Microvirga antarctica]|uniref:DMT family transporter n=1 Tax=Microvirga antarctica TaxID=2819233 RepID=UPI001FEBCDCB|nr:DMT family transporter [Microvirga antarctica]